MGEAGRRLLPIGVILRILDWTGMRGGYGVRIVFNGCVACGYVPERRAPRFNRNGGIAQTSRAA